MLRAAFPLETILLAAGRSRRMQGIYKLLLPVGGEPLIRRSAALHAAQGWPLVVVVNAQGVAEIEAALAGIACRIIVNPLADSGPHSSIIAGLGATPLRAPGIVIALADQPLLTRADIAALAAHYRAAPDRIAIPRHAGQRGNPVILPQAVARALAAPGAPTPRGFIDANPALVAWFDTPRAAFLRDIDTRADAEALLGAALSTPSIDRRPA